MEVGVSGFLALPYIFTYDKAKSGDKGARLSHRAFANWFPLSALERRDRDTVIATVRER